MAKYIFVIATLVLLEFLVVVQSVYFNRQLEKSETGYNSTETPVTDQFVFPDLLTQEPDLINEPTTFESEVTPFSVQVNGIINAGNENKRLKQKYLVTLLECDIAKITRKIQRTEEELRRKLATCSAAIGYAKGELEITRTDPRTIGIDILYHILSNILSLPRHIICAVVNCPDKEEPKPPTQKPTPTPENTNSNKTRQIDDERNVYYCDVDDTENTAVDLVADDDAYNCDVSPWLDHLSKLYSFFQ